jgi:hypothetical protein
MTQEPRTAHVTGAASQPPAQKHASAVQQYQPGSMGVSASQLEFSRRTCSSAISVSTSMPGSSSPAAPLCRLALCSWCLWYFGSLLRALPICSRLYTRTTLSEKPAATQDSDRGSTPLVALLHGKSTSAMCCLWQAVNVQLGSSTYWAELRRG